MSDKSSCGENLPKTATRRGRSRARLTALIRIGYKAPSDTLTKPGWPRWEEAIIIMTSILYDIEAEMKNYSRQSADDPCEQWQEAFRKRLKDTIEDLDDPFFGL
jgi:hypothetical protein